MPPRNVKIRDRLIAYALSFPESWEDRPWEEDLVVKVRKKIFVFFGDTPTDGSVGVCVKLPESNLEALAYDFTSPAGYGLGKAGWVNAIFPRDVVAPVDMLEEWIDESYRAIAPKTLVKLLDAPPGP
jgi:predicted DNA-binding protein (MmcQ/YjbR family)